MYYFSITRDNASSNNTLIEALTKHYEKEGLRFQGDIPCIAHVLNLVIQDIIKGIIKEDYDSSYINDIYTEENDSEEQNTSKLI